MHLLSIAAALMLPLAADAPPPGTPCVRQPLPPALDAVARPGTASEVIEFSAAPSLELPGRAWIVRLVRRGDAATAEVIRLRRQFDCNRYDVEQRWSAPLNQQDYDDLAARIVPLGLPPRGAFDSRNRGQDIEVVADGTGLELRLRTTDWQVTRTSNHFGKDGLALSAAFRAIAARYVPADQMPAEDWRTAPRR